MEFLMIDGEILINDKIYTADKLILSYFKNLQNKGKGYWGSTEYLAKTLGMKPRNLETRLHELEKYGIINRVDKTLYLALEWEFIAKWDGTDTHKSNLTEILENFTNKMRV